MSDQVIRDGWLTFNGDHPLAGKALRVHVKINELRDPTRDGPGHDALAATGAGPLH
jgi:FKBP-type peptidyl-prolyl cis-trans isomerase 2